MNIHGWVSKRLRGLAFRLALLAGAALALLFLAAACGDGDGGDEDAAAEDAVRAGIQAWNDGDLDGFLGAFTDQGVEALFGGFSREEVTQFFSEGEGGVGDPQIEIAELSVEADTDEATAEMTTVEGAFQFRERVTLIQQEGAWLVNDFEHLTQDVPDGKTAVDLSLLEYRFGFDEGAITGGDLAFNISNVGGEAHEMSLSRVPADLNIEEALQSEEEPEGVEDIGFAGPFAPGSDLTAILVNDLEPGRYVMLCFVPNSEGTPHAFLGMIGEFTIE